MERKNRHVSGLLVAAFLACIAQQVQAAESTNLAPGAFPHFGMMHRHHGEGGTGCPADKAGAADSAGTTGPWTARLESLGVTAEQRLAIQQVALRYRDRGLVLAQRGSAIREQWMSVAPDDPGYPQATEDAAATAADLAADGLRLLAEMRSEMHALLTPEQRQQMKEQAQKERQRWDDWRNRHQQPSQ